MMPTTRSDGRNCLSSRSVASKFPNHGARIRESRDELHHHGLDCRGGDGPKRRHRGTKLAEFVIVKLRPDIFAPCSLAEREQQQAARSGPVIPLARGASSEAVGGGTLDELSVAARYWEIGRLNCGVVDVWAMARFAVSRWRALRSAIALLG